MHDRFSDCSGKVFEMNIRAHLDDHRGECPYIGCKMERPDISNLNGSQLDWYLHWRDRVLAGEYIVTDMGYCFILFSEILVRDLDPSDVRRICDGLLGNIRFGYDEMIEEFLYGYQIAHGIDPDYPSYRRFSTVEDGTPGALSNLLVYPQSDIPAHFISQIGNLADTYLDREEADRIAPYYSRAVRAVGELLNSRGTGILEEYGEGRRTITRNILQQYPTFHGEDTYILDFTDVRLKGRMGRFLGGLLRLVMKILNDRDGKDGPSVPSFITKDLRKAVKDALNGKNNCFDGNVERIPDLVFTRLSEHSASERTLLVPMPEASEAAPTGALRESIIEYADRRPGPRMEYIPSGMRTPEHSRLRNGRLEYFIQWREDVRNGIHGRTDEGYLWLLMTELLNHGDPKESFNIMMRIRDVYDPHHCDDGLGKGILFHALVHDIDIPSTDLCERDPLCIARVLAQMDRNGIGELTLGSFEEIASYVSKTPVAGFDRACARAMNTVLRRVAEIRDGMDGRDERTVFGNYLCADVLLKNETPYRYYGFPGKDRSFKVRIPKIDSRYDCENIKDLMVECAGMMQEIRAGKVYKIKYRHFARVDIGDILEEACGMELRKASLDSVKSKREVRRKVDLDRDAVDSAERDLEDVTDMMRVDEPDDPRTVDVPTVIVQEADVPDDPWSVFGSSLTDDERMHLGGILDGLSGKDVRLEDSINAKAVDSVGDTVVEDGRVVDDYKPELEGLIRKSDTPGISPSPTEEQYRYFETTLTGPDREYIINLASRRHILGRRPSRRIESINCKAVLNIGSELIRDGRIVPEHFEWAKTLKDRT